MINAGIGHETIAAFGCTFEGRIAWMSVPRSGDPVVCWLDGVAFESTSFRVHHRLPALVAEYVR